MPQLTINGREIGPGRPAYIVAELSANHRQEFSAALRLVAAAQAAGADAVKIQTYTPDSLTIDCDRPEFIIGPGSPWTGRKLYELYGEAATPYEWHAPLQAEAEKCGIDFFSTPFDPAAVDFLESLQVPAHKIASFELPDGRLLRRVAATGKPVILSTGLADREEIAWAVDELRRHGCRQLALLRCASAYPAPLAALNLRLIPRLGAEFDAVAGLSDHTLGHVAAGTAVALGASVIEKHLTLSRAAGGPDAEFSLEPAEFADLVRTVRQTEAALGGAEFGLTPAEAAGRAFRRSLFVVADVKAGEPFTPANLRAIRPGQGLSPRYYEEILGRCAIRDLERGTPLAWDMLA